MHPLFNVSLTIALAVASPALATHTQFFKHADRAAFETGTMENVVATNFGELRLSRAVEAVLKDEGKYASIDAIAEGPDGTIYFGTTASGKLLALSDGKTTELADYGEAAGVSAIAVTAGGDVIIGVSGERAEVQIRHKGDAKPSRFIQLPEGTQYIWSIALAADGKIYLGTGPDGQLFEVSADGKTSKVIYDSDEDNLRAIVILNDTIFVGTDPNGLILKVDRSTGKAFVIYDAPETEISALLVDPRGGQIYAATSQLVEGTDETEAATASGRPNGGGENKPLSIEPKEDPKPGADHGGGDGGLNAGLNATKLPVVADAADHDGPTSHPASENAAPNSAAGPKATTEANAGGDATDAATNGNAVYRIEPQGFVSEVFRDQAMIFGLARQDDQLFIATGPNGTVFQLDLASEEHTAIAKVRPSQVTSIFSTADNRLLIGTGGGTAEAHVLSAKLAKEGTFTSPVLDATQISQFGKLQVLGTIADGTKLNVQTRSGNIADEESPLWSEWSAAVPAARFTAVMAPSARYAQYKLIFAGDGTKSPSVAAIEFAYLQPNVAPRIDSITIAEPTQATDDKTGEVSGDPNRSIEWASTEPNGDELRFTVSVRAAHSDAPWTPIAKDLAEASYQWDTRRVADGRYDVKVEASDALANAAGMGKTASRTQTIEVDNTPPVIGDIKVEHARGNATVNVRAADKGGMIAGFEYCVDDQEHWQSVPPSDMLNDSPDEQYTIVLPDPGSSTRVVSLRCTDENGNTAHESVTVRPEK